METVGSVNVLPEQTGAICVNAGTVGAVTFMVIVLLVTLVGEAQAALLTITQETVLPFASVVVV